MITFVTDREDFPTSDPLEVIAALGLEVAQLRDAVRVRDEFISIAAHELRNPMTPLLMTVQSLCHLAERHPGTAEQIVTGLTRLDRVVVHYINRCNSLLDISRLSSDRFRIEWAEVDLGVLVRDTVEEMRPYAERAGSQVDLTAPEGLRGVWDELAVRQIAENLLSNAIKYGAGQPISVSMTVVQASEQAGERESVLLEVCDRGIGISAADQARIFAPFERAVTRQQQPGFGLGLWVVGRLAAALGGTVQVSSIPGEGSNFSVRLPRDQATRPG